MDIEETVIVGTIVGRKKPHNSPGWGSRPKECLMPAEVLGRDRHKTLNQCQRNRVTERR